MTFRTRSGFAAHSARGVHASAACGLSKTMTIARPWSTSRLVADGTATASAAQKFTAGSGVLVAVSMVVTSFTRCGPSCAALRVCFTAATEMTPWPWSLHEVTRTAAAAIRATRVIRTILRRRGFAIIPQCWVSVADNLRP